MRFITICICPTLLFFLFASSLLAQENWVTGYVINPGEDFQSFREQLEGAEIPLFGES